MAFIFSIPSTAHLNTIKAGHANNGSGNQTSLDADDITFLSFYCIFAVLQIFFLIVIFKDKALRECHSNWFPLAAVIAMFINMILMMTALIGTNTSLRSWNNILELCYPLTIIQLSSGNWPSAYLIVTVIGWTMRYNRGDLDRPAYPAKRAILNLISTTTVVTGLTCLVVFGFGPGHRINTHVFEYGQICYVIVNRGMSIATTAFHTFMLCFLLITSSFLLRDKINHFIISGRRHALDSTTAILIIAAIWFFLNLPYIVISGVAGDRLTDQSSPIYPYVRVSHIIYLTAFGWVPALWVWLDPEYRASVLRLCPTWCCSSSMCETPLSLLGDDEDS